MQGPSTHDPFVSQARGLLFHRLAQQAVAIEPMPYRLIIGAVRAAKND